MRVGFVCFLFLKYDSQVNFQEYIIERDENWGSFVKKK